MSFGEKVGRWVLHLCQLFIHSRERCIIKLSVYNLKSQFQNLLKPIESNLISCGVTPNQITLFTCILCLIYAMFLSQATSSSFLLVFLPAFMFIRMALNALDGMIANKTNQQTPLGSVLNEICDVIADTALFSLFFAFFMQYSLIWALLIFLVLLTEFLSLAVFQANGVRSHSGPFGKSDRAVYLGILAFIVFIFGDMFTTSYWVLAYIMLGYLLAGMTLLNRFQSLNSDK